MAESHVAFSKPEAGEYNQYYQGYIDQIPDGMRLSYLESQVQELNTLFQSVSEQEAAVVHPPYSWTIKQVLGHMIDAERIFADRIHRFSSGETQPQPGFDQDAYVHSQNYRTPLLASLVEELALCRRANVMLIQRTNPDVLNRRGIASNCLVSVRALIWITAGHWNHHLNIMRKRLKR